MGAMRTSISIGGAASGREDFQRVVDFTVEAEKLGVDAAWSAEAWGQDAVSPLAYPRGAHRRGSLLGTGIMQISARAPVMTAMTAMTMAAITGGRFLLGLGASGPQVVEGLHGGRSPSRCSGCARRSRSCASRSAASASSTTAATTTCRCPGGEGKALRLAQPANPNIPIYLATLGPKLARAHRRARRRLARHLVHARARRGAPRLPAARRRARGAQPRRHRRSASAAPCAFSDDVEPLVAARKPHMAFTLGAMGSRKTNFYNDAYRRGGFDDAAIEVQRLWLEGKRDEAAARVPDEMVLQSSLIGTESMVRERVRKYRDAGINMLRLEPMGETPTERLDTLDRALEIVRQECDGASSAAAG